MPEVSQICELYHVEDYGSKINYSLAVKKYQPEKKAAIVSDIFSTVLYIIGEDGIDAEKIEEIRQSVSAKSYIDDETWDMVEKAFRGVVVGVNAAVAADYYGNVGKVESGSKTNELVLKGTEYSPEYIQKLQDTYSIFKNNGYEISEHGLNRILGRINQGKISSIEEVLDVLKNGTRYKDTVNGGIILYKNGISIHIADDGFIKTVIGKAKVKSTWEVVN